MITLDLRRLHETGELGRALIFGLDGAGLLILDAELRLLLIEGDVHSHLDRAAVVGRPVSEVISAEAWELLAPRYAAALLGQVQSFNFDHPSDYSSHWLRFAPVRDESSAVVGVMVISQDITVRAQARKRVAKSERLQRSVLGVLDEGVLVVGLEGQLLQANAAASAILGIDLDAAGSSWWEQLSARRRSDGSVLEVGATVLSTGEELRGVEVDIDRPDGRRVALSLNYLPLLDEDGGATGLVLSFRDVTEQVREHEQLVELQERLIDAHEVARLASWEWQPDSDEVLIFHALAADPNTPGSRVKLDDLLAAQPAEEQQGMRDDMAAIVRGELDTTCRRHGRNHPEGPVWLESRSRAIRDADGRLICVRGTTQDVTDQELSRQQAADTRDFLRAVLDSRPAHTAVLNARGEIIMTNRAWETFGSANDSCGSGQGANYFAACDAAAGDAMAARAVAGLRAIVAGTETEFAMTYPCHSDTEKRWFVLRATAYDGPGEARVVVAHENVTERHIAEQEVATQAALLDEVDVSVIASDLQGRVTHWNRGAERLHGWTSAETVGRDILELIAASAGERTPEARADLRRLGRWEGELSLTRRDGSTFPAYVRERIMFDADGNPTGAIGVLVDISDRVTSERRLLRARNYLRAVADGMGEGLFTIDPDGCVTYMNRAAENLLGWSAVELQGRLIHDVTHSERGDGSELTIEDSPILRAGHSGDTVRVEGDVFIRRDGSRLPVAYTAAPFETDDGIAGCVVVFEDISERKLREESLQREVETLSWVARVKDALAEDRFELHAQPIVDLTTREVVQRELLLRVREPDGTIAPPGPYLKVAEQSDLILEIDRWVIERGAEIAADGFAVEINLSARSMGDASILRHIERCIARSGADPTRMVFEITETALVDDEAAAREFAHRLHALGCKLALDDFGTGYCGFTYLKHLPIDYLKIDIEFVRDLASNPASHHVVEAVVALASAFDLQTVAEGVEDADALELLRALGVDFAQGFHIARPRPLSR